VAIWYPIGTDRVHHPTYYPADKDRIEKAQQMKQVEAAIAHQIDPIYGIESISRSLHLDRIWRVENLVWEHIDSKLWETYWEIKEALTSIGNRRSMKKTNLTGEITIGIDKQVRNQSK